jgi:hypothetical protein
MIVSITVTFFQTYKQKNIFNSVELHYICNLGLVNSQKQTFTAGCTEMQLLPHYVNKRTGTYKTVDNRYALLNSQDNKAVWFKPSFLNLNVFGA